VTALRQKLQGIDELAEDFTLRMDARRKNIATAINFYRLASQVVGSSTQHDTVFALVGFCSISGQASVLCLHKLYFKRLFAVITLAVTR